MSPFKAIISLAALLIATISAAPTQVHERAVSCPSGSFRVKLFYENANGQMVWNGQYVYDLGGPLGSTSSASQARSFYLDSNSNLIENDDDSFTGCILRAPFGSLPTNTTVFTSKADCQADGYPLVECIKTPQYNMCWAGPNKVIQQCGEFILFNAQQIPSAGGASCGPALNFFIDNC